MLTRILVEANALLSKIINNTDKKDVFSKIDTLFRVAEENEPELSPLDGEDLSFRYTNFEKFRSQTRHLTEINPRKYTKKERPSDLNIRLSANSLLAIELFDILGINVKDYFRDLRYQLEIHNENKEIISENSYDFLFDEISEIKEMLLKQRKENHTIQEIWTMLYSSCMVLESHIELIKQIHNNNLEIIKTPIPVTTIEEYNKSIEYPFVIILQTARNLEQFAPNQALTKKIIRTFRPKKGNEDSEGQVYLNEIESQVYLYLIYLIVSIMLDFLGKVKNCQETAKKHNLNILGNKIIDENPSEAVFSGLNKKRTDKAAIEIFDKSTLSFLQEAFSNISNSVYTLLSHYSKSNSYLFDSTNLLNLLQELIEQTKNIFMTQNVNINRFMLNQNKTIQDFVRADNLFDFTFSIKDELKKDIESFVKKTQSECSIFIDNIKKHAEVKIPPKSKLNKNPLLEKLHEASRTFIFDSFNKKITPIIALDMGTGKTRLACTAIKRFIEENKIRKDNENNYILVIVPARLIKDWQNELAYNNITTSIKMIGNGRKKYFVDGKICSADMQVFITSYGMAANDYSLYMNKLPVLIVYDEIQNINPQKVLDKCLVLAEMNKNIPNKIGLSGTPMQNDTTEFFINYCFFHDFKMLEKSVTQGLIKSQSWDKENDFIKVKSELKNKRYYFFGKVKLDVEMDIKFIPIRISEADQQKIEYFYDDNSNLQANLTLNPADFNYYENSTKISFIKQFLSELPKDEKVIIFSYFRNPLKILNSQLKDSKPTLIIGNKKDNAVEADAEEDIFDISNDEMPKEDETPLDKFRNYKSYRVLLGTIKMIGTGENLQVANNMVILDLWWNPMVIIQTMHRIIRLQQNKKVRIYFPFYTDKDGKAIFQEKKKWQVMNDKINLYNKFLTDIGHEEGVRSFPTTSLAQPLIFDQTKSSPKKWLLEEIENGEITQTDYWFKDKEKKRPVSKKITVTIKKKGQNPKEGLTAHFEIKKK